MAEQPRFLLLSDVAEILNTSQAQVYALVRRKELLAMKIGGRGQWRVSTEHLEQYIQQMYAEAGRFIDDHPFTGKDADDERAEDDQVVDEQDVSG
jgi:excisionase family DNA binding protein